MSELTPEQKLGAAVLDCLGELSDRSLRQLRSGNDPRPTDRSLISRTSLARLIAAMDAAYPQAIDLMLSKRRMEGLGE